MCEGTSEALICLQASGFLQIIRLFKRPSVDLGCSSWNSSRLRPPSQPGARWSLSSWTACSLRHPSRWHPSRSAWLRGRAPPCSRGGRGSSHRRSETGLGSGGSQADNQNYRMMKTNRSELLMLSLGWTRDFSFNANYKSLKPKG